jgi:predicted Zn finger-like uncharacterized protein
VNVTCPDCKSVFRVDPAKVPIGGVRARCSICGGVMSVPAQEFATPWQPIPSVPEAPSPVASSSERPAAVASGVDLADDELGSDAEAAPEFPFDDMDTLDVTPVPARGGPLLPPRAAAGPPAGPITGTSTPTEPMQTAPSRAATQSTVPSRPITPSAPVRAPFNPPARPPAQSPLPATPLRPALPPFSARGFGSPSGAPRPGPGTPPQSPAAAAPPASTAPSAPRNPAAAGTPIAAPMARGVAPDSAVPSPVRPSEALPPSPVSTGSGVGAERPGAAGALPRSDVSAKRPINPFLANDPNQKAKRLARALVSDMVAYLPQKREEGLRNNTLKVLFREEIKKSYEEYVDQIGKEIAEGTTHFQDALNDVLSGGRKIF